MRTKGVLPLTFVLALCFVPTWAQDREAEPSDQVPGEVLVRFAPKAPPAAILDAARTVGPV